MVAERPKPNAAYVPGLISSTLGWERVRNWNVGVDFGLLNNRLTGSFDYYNRLTLDMIGPAPELPLLWVRMSRRQTIPT